MTSAVYPAYPLYPIACILASAMLLLVFLTSFIRQSWNLGVAFLCFWLFFENLTLGIDAVIWSDNGDIKLYTYCDIVTHVQEIAAVVKPMATLIITRRLCLIVSAKSVQPLSKAAKRRELLIDWILGLVIPMIVAGPFYYVVQILRFQVFEGIGCGNANDTSVLSILLLNSWNVIPPLVSITVYYPAVIRTFYRHNQDVQDFLQSNDSVSRVNYLRILALASIDILLTLPIGIATIALNVTAEFSRDGVPFYFGWDYDHDPAEWKPESASYAETVANGASTMAQIYFSQWTSPVLAFIIFGFFGVTSEARASYWRIICTICGWLGCQPRSRTDSARTTSLGEIEFGERPVQDVSLNLDPEPVPSPTNPGAQTRPGPNTERGHGLAATAAESDASKDRTEEPRLVPGNIACVRLAHVNPKHKSYCAEIVDAQSVAISPLIASSAGPSFHLGKEAGPPGTRFLTRGL